MSLNEMLQKYFIVLILYSLLGLVGCGGGSQSNGDSNSPTDSSSKSIAISGEIDIPNYSASKTLVLVSGSNNQSFYAGAIDPDEKINIEFKIPATETYLLISAVVADNPEAFTMAFINLEEDIASNKTFNNNKLVRKPDSRDSSINLFPVRIDAESTAEVLVRNSTGKLGTDEADVLSPNELAVKKVIQTELLKSNPQFCSVGAPPEVNSQLRELSSSRVVTIRGRFDEILSQPDKLSLDKLKEAEQIAASNVWSDNRIPIWNPLSPSVKSARAAIKAVAPDVITLDGFEIGTISFNDLELIAQIIMDQGWGNCREKAIMGAYIASRLNEFKQVAIVGFKTTLSNHAVAIACKEDSKVWDINGWWFVPTTTQEMKDYINYDADCVVIDPWKGETVALTPEYVSKQNWKFVLRVLTVDLKSLDASHSTVSNRSISYKSQLAKTSAEESDIKFCAPDDSGVSSCESFEIPKETCRLNKNGEFACEPLANTGDTTNVTPSEKYYLFKRSGNGYRKMWAGWANSLTGYDYFFLHILASDLQTQKAAYSQFEQATTNACDRGPALCPCPPTPDIWQSGNVELIGSFNTAEEMDSFRCDNPHYGPYNLICNMWEVDSDPKYWEPINAICSG